MTTNNKLTIGVDFGTDSVRALVVDTSNGETLGTAVHYYTRWKQGLYCNPSQSQFRQHPLDYIEGIESAIKGALVGLSADARQNVLGISVDTTGSTPVAVDKNGTPLALLPAFQDNPNAMFILWKDHTANKEAQQINELARKWGIDYTQYVGGIYSSEWFWAKILHILRVDEEVRKAAFSWVEHCDYISALLTGNTNPQTIHRSRCAAGHKAMWHGSYEGLPSDEFFSTLDPLLAGLRDNLFEETRTSDLPMGTISVEWAEKLGLPNNVTIGVGAFDCHMGAVGAEIQPFDFVRVMGTSTCDMIIVPNEEYGDVLVKGICGQVDGSIVPGMLGLEAGQSAYGDYYAWFQKIITEPVRAILGEEAADKMASALIPHLAEEAAKLPVTLDDIIATDWINGRRTPDANHEVKASIRGLHIGTDAIKIFKAIVEATAFGSKAIVDRFIEEGIPIKQVIAIGGVANKSSFVMQVLADVLNMPIKVAKAEQACALGAAMNAAVAAGIHPNIDLAQSAMGSGFDASYTPRPQQSETYQQLYKHYQSLGKFTEQNA
ncbi:MAG: ribulokinase [Saprospiraceae bacterium]